MIKAPELEQALLVLPFSQVETIANFLVKLLAAGLEVELCARCAIFLLRVHQVKHPKNASHRALASVDDVKNRGAGVRPDHFSANPCLLVP